MPDGFFRQVHAFLFCKPLYDANPDTERINNEGTIWVVQI